MRKIYISLVFALAAAPFTAHAVHCLEYFELSGETSLVPSVTELTPSEVTFLFEQTKAEGGKAIKVSSKQKLALRNLSGNNGAVVTTFPNLEGEFFQVVGLENDMPYLRPELPAVRGFLQPEFPKTAKAAAVVTDPSIGQHASLVKTRGRALVYGMAEKTPSAIRLETNEIISGVVNLNSDTRLAITSRIDQKPGFPVGNTDRARNYMMEVYLIQPTGHAFVGFRVRAVHESYPVVQVLQMNLDQLLLQVDGQFFRVNLTRG